MTLSIGDIAPDFSLPATHPGADSTRLTLKDLLDKDYLVLYFYPKDDTPGCTNEAKDFSEHLDAFNAAGVTVAGVSKDPLTKHEKFTAKHDLKIILLSDEEGSMVENYGVWVEKKMYGRTYMGLQRATYLIDKSGKIVAVWPNVKVKGHSEDVLSTVQKKAG